MQVFDPSELKKLFKPNKNSNGEDNGQVTVIGGSKLFHGAPIFSLKIASRIVDMVFFATPDSSVGRIAESIKSKLMSFIWIPWDDVEVYVKKSDAVLIGPGFMRFGSEKISEEDRGNGEHKEAKETREITRKLLSSVPNKRWVIDGGSLQVMDPEWIPEGAIITPNKKEFGILFRVNEEESRRVEVVEEMAKKYKCIIVAKGSETVVSDGEKTAVIKGGNAGMTKGGTGDVLAGLTVALLAKNDPFLAACSASYVAKAAAEELYTTVGVNYNSDDLANQVPKTLNRLVI